ncbi:uncharacterized protein LOC119359396 isoform X2 [Triticum dicoccoides]|uniref:uncharacterized protein LOC119359396 isoform X2 n=1 Tax=Triticum dicoccoides TaxID=85692 RepID=UPI00188F31CB|nr:uncharacterized protein LOC119359396 isoform X2 [Triticum dicoccoides]
MKSSPPMPAASGDLRRRAARPKLPTVRASLPSIQTLCSRPLQPARNHTPMARVRAWLRRRVSDVGARHGSSPSTTVAAVKEFFKEMSRTPWTCSSSSGGSQIHRSLAAA